MTQVGPGAPDDIRKLIQASIEADFAESYSAFDPESLAWLSLPPAWTHRLAQVCRFPSGDMPLERFLERAEAAGLCIQRPGNESTREPASFWVEDAARDAVLKRLRTDTRFGASRLRSIAGRIGQAMRKGAGDAAPVPDVIGRWAELAARSDGGDSANEWFGGYIAGLVQTDATGVASAWLDTGASLARSLGGALAGTVRLGQRWLELSYRRAQDERHLKRYQDRPELTRPLEQLLDPGTSVWALHYLGIGGVGKTMLMRYITARMGPGRRFPVTRVDFDHLSPDYPVRQPGQLLLELAADLRAYGSSSHDEKLLDYLRVANGELIERLGMEPEPADPLANIRRPEFDKVVSVFAEFLSGIERPRGTPVVLILDTCEELARVTLPGGVQPAVAATFEVLERVHKHVDDVRVVLAGRRLLAASGHDWRVSDDVRPALEKRLPARTFLALQEIRGFTRGESIDFLTRTNELTIGSEQRDAILKRSRDTGAGAPLADRPAEQERFNPFDLALYAAWLREDPDVAALEITSGRTDPYVEMRIVHRLRQSPVRPLVPAVLLLQRFDEVMLRAAAPSLTDAEFESAFRELADQEWIEVQQSGGRVFCEVDRNLHSRLLAYFQSPPRDRLLAETADRLAPVMADIVRQRSLRDIGVEHVNSALALLPLADAALLLHALMRRVAESAEWNWANQVFGRLLGAGQLLDAVGASAGMPEGLSEDEDGEEDEYRDEDYEDGEDEDEDDEEDDEEDDDEEEEEDHDVDVTPDDGGHAVVSGLAIRRHPELRAALLATMNSAALHLGTATDLASAWREVSRRAADDPEPGVSRWLAARASVGMAAEFLRSNRDVPAEVFAAAWHELATFEPVPADHSDRWLSEQLAASLCAGLAEGLAELNQASDAAEVLEAFVQKLTGGGYPQALLLLAQVVNAATRAGDRDGPHLHELQSTVGALVNEASLQIWTDWRLPEPFGDHLRLRLWNVAPQVLDTYSPTLGLWWRSSLSWLRSPESERWLSALLGNELKFRAVDVQAGSDGWRPSLREIRDADAAAYDPSRRSSSRVHRGTPALFVTIADVYAAAGDPEQAFEVIRMRRQEAASTQRDAATVRDADLARLRIARRYRVAQPGIVDRIQGGEDVEMIRETLAVAALAGPDRVPVDPPPDVLADGATELARTWWSVQSALTLQQRQHLVAAARPLFATAASGSSRPPDPRASALATEYQEFEALQPGRLVKDPGESRVTVEDVLEGRVLVIPSRWDEASGQFDRVGRRTVAQALFERGELLALRLPSAGGRLLASAANLYAECDDMVGTWMASIAAAIAWGHAGEFDRARELLDTVTRPVHERLRAELPDQALPAWTELEGAPDAASVNWVALTPLTQGQPPLESLWSGWLLRVAMCRWVASRRDRSLAGTEVAALKQDTRWQWNRPSELEPIGFDGGAAAGSPAPVAASPPAPVSRAGWTLALTSVIGVTALLTLGWWIASGAFSQLPAVNGGVVESPRVTDLLSWIRIARLDAISIRYLLVVLLGGAGLGVMVFGRNELRTVIAGQAVAIGVLAAAYWAVGWFSARVLAYPLTPGWQIAALALVIGLLSAAPSLGRAVARVLTAWLTLGASYALHVDEASGYPRQSSAAGLDYRSSMVQFSATLDGRRVTLQWAPPFGRTVYTSLQASGETPALELGAITEALGPMETELRALRVALFRGSVAVPIEIRGSQAQGMPWEAALARTGASNPHVVDQLRVWRSGGALDPWGLSHRYTDLWRDERLIVVLAASAWFDIGEGWLSSKSVRGAGFPFASVRQEVVESLKVFQLRARTVKRVLTDNARDVEELRPAILHVTGTPVLTSAGIRLRLSDDAGWESKRAPGDTSGQQIGVPNLRVSEASIVVVQGTPAESRGRLDADREQAANLRLFANEVIEAGAASVVVIPSLPPSLAEAVAADIASVSRKRRPTLRILLAAIARARRRVIAHGGEDWLEASYDICLFGGRRQQGRYVA